MAAAQDTLTIIIVLDFLQSIIPPYPVLGLRRGLAGLPNAPTAYMVVRGAHERRRVISLHHDCTGGGT